MQIIGVHRITIERDGLGFRSLWSYPPTPPPDVAVGKTSLFVTQELPWHPRSAFSVGVQGPDVSPIEITHVLITQQELPWHPPAKQQLYAGIQGPDVASISSLKISVFVRQEQPYHPLWPQPILRAGTTPISGRSFGYIIH